MLMADDYALKIELLHAHEQWTYCYTCLAFVITGAHGNGPE